MKNFKSLFKNPTFSTWYYTFSKGLVFAVLTAYIITTFDNYIITCWYLFSTISGIIHFFDLSFSTTIIRFVSYARVNKKLNIDVKRIYAIFNSIYFILSSLALFTIVLGYFVWVKPILNEDYENEITKSYIIFSIGTIIAFFMKRNDAFIKGLDKVSLYFNWNGFFSLFQGLCLIVVIYLDGSFTSLIITQQVIVILNSIKNKLLLSSKSSIAGLKFEWDFDVFVKYWEPTWKSALISMSTMGISQFTAAFIPTWYGTYAAASYLFTIKLATYIGELAYAPFYSKVPNYIYNFKNGLLTKGNTELLKMISSINLSLILFVVGLMILGVFGTNILILLRPNTTIIEETLFVIVSFYLFVERFNGIFSQVIMFSNNVTHYKNYLISSVCFVVLVVFFKDIGLWIIPMSYLISFSYSSVKIFQKALISINTPTLYFLEKMKTTFLFWIVFVVIYFFLV